MPFVRRRPKSAKPVGKRFVKRKTTTAKRKTTKSFRTKVKQVVKRMQEVKQYNTGLETSEQISYYGGGLIEYFDLITGFMNNIINGTADGQRIGDKISTRMFVLRGYLHIQVDGQTAGVPTIHRMLVIKDKQNVTPGSNQFTDLFEGGAVQAPVNTLQDIMKKINNERYTVLAQRIFKIATSNTTNFNNNDFKLSKFFRIDLTKDLKQFVYNTSSNTVMNHPSLYCIWLSAPADGSTGLAGTQTQVEYSLSAEYNYTDS